MTEEMKVQIRIILQKEGEMTERQLAKAIFPDRIRHEKTPEQRRVRRTLDSMRKWQEVAYDDGKWRLI